MNDSAAEPIAWRDSKSEKLVLRAGEVHVWRARLDRSSAEIAEFRRLLSVDEVERAGRFRFDEHRSAFIAARGVLRSLLAVYCEQAPATIAFDYAYAGKPQLAERSRVPSLAFNLSHSGAWAVAAVIRASDTLPGGIGENSVNQDNQHAGTQGIAQLHREIGIDIEAYRPMDEMAGIAKRYFAAAEFAAWQRAAAASGDAAIAAFFRCWTRKEAYLKALGDGLRAPLDAFEVSIDAAGPQLIKASPHDGFAQWTIRDLPVGDGYTAAVVMPADCRIAGWLEWT